MAEKIQPDSTMFLPTRQEPKKTELDIVCPSCGEFIEVTTWPPSEE